MGKKLFYITCSNKCDATITASNEKQTNKNKVKQQKHGLFIDIEICKVKWLYFNIECYFGLIVVVPWVSAKKDLLLAYKKVSSAILE